MAEPLARALARMERFFDLSHVERAGSEARAIQSYYRVTRHAYSRYHDPGNAVHMDLSEGAEFDPDDLKAQARFVEGQLPRGARTIVELATGRGANALWLARRHPNLTVHGLDLTEAQLAHARRKGAGMANFHPVRGDYHDLSRFADASADLVFVVEALSHSDDKQRVAAEVARILRPGGLFIVIDGYRGRPKESCTTDENRALALLARGTAVTAFRPYEDARGELLGSGLDFVDEQDRSARNMPSLKRCAAPAERYMNRPVAAWPMRRLLPRQLVNTGGSSAPFPQLLKQGLFTYWITVLRRPEADEGSHQP